MSFQKVQATSRARSFWPRRFMMGRWQTSCAATSR